MAYQAENKVRFVTAASLFDGHDAAINIMRRILQAQGAEVIHLGHNRSVKEIVDAAVQEDAQGIAVSSYQGGHIEFFKYMIDLLKERGAEHIKVYGGGGGVIVPREIKELEDYGVAKIFSPDDGREMGLDGMIAHMIEGADFDPAKMDSTGPLGPTADRWLAVARAITCVEEGLELESPQRADPAGRSRDLEAARRSRRRLGERPASPRRNGPSSRRCRTPQPARRSRPAASTQPGAGSRSRGRPRPPASGRSRVAPGR